MYCADYVCNMFRPFKNLSFFFFASKALGHTFDKASYWNALEHFHPNSKNFC